MQTWLQSYVAAQHKALDSVSLEEVSRPTETVRAAWLRDAQIFAIGNGGSAANASHFASPKTNLKDIASSITGVTRQLLTTTA
jgi:D-sedoheptulose 7-phosphate isomerase